MTTKTIFRLLGLALMMGAVIAVPAEARAAITENVGFVTGYIEEILIGVGAIIALIAIDMSSWSLMTSKR